VGRGFFAASLSALLVIVVLVLVLVVLVILVVVIVIVIVVANDSTAEERGYRSVRARRSIGVVQDEFATTEDGL
jgi:flagellar basal body-associated protein FliL